MKKNSLLLPVLGALLVATASAARSENESPLSLPTFVVAADRDSGVEDHVNLSLAALRDLARAPVAVSVELPALKVPLTSVRAAFSGARLANS